MTVRACSFAQRGIGFGARHRAFRGLIPFDATPALSAGKAALSEALAGRAALSERMAAVVLAEVLAGSAGLLERGGRGLLAEALAGQAGLSASAFGAMLAEIAAMPENTQRRARADAHAGHDR